MYTKLSTGPIKIRDNLEISMNGDSFIGGKVFKGLCSKKKPSTGLP